MDILRSWHSLKERILKVHPCEAIIINFIAVFLHMISTEGFDFDCNYTGQVLEPSR